MAAISAMVRSWYRPALWVELLCPESTCLLAGDLCSLGLRGIAVQHKAGDLAYDAISHVMSSERSVNPAVCDSACPCWGTVTVNARERSDGFDSPGIDDCAGRDGSARVCSSKSATLPNRNFYIAEAVMGLLGHSDKTC